MRVEIGNNLVKYQVSNFIAVFKRAFYDKQLNALFMALEVIWSGCFFHRQSHRAAPTSIHRNWPCILQLCRVLIASNSISLFLTYNQKTHYTIMVTRPSAERAAKRQQQVSKQGWHSGESTRLPPMWPAFKPWRQSHQWVEFVVGSFLCSERFFSRYSSFPLS